MLTLARKGCNIAAAAYAGLAGFILLVKFSIPATGATATLFLAASILAFGVALWSLTELLFVHGKSEATEAATQLGFKANSDLYYKVMLAISGAGTVGGFILNSHETGFLSVLATLIAIGSAVVLASTFLLYRLLVNQVTRLESAGFVPNGKSI